MWNPLLELLFLEHVNDIVDSYLVDLDLAKIALSCHFSLECTLFQGRSDRLHTVIHWARLPMELHFLLWHRCHPRDIDVLQSEADSHIRLPAESVLCAARRWFPTFTDLWKSVLPSCTLFTAHVQYGIVPICEMDSRSLVHLELYLFGRIFCFSRR